MVSQKPRVALRQAGSPSCQQGCRPTTPEKEEQSRLGDSTEVQPTVQITKQACSNETNWRSVGIQVSRSRAVRIRKVEDHMLSFLQWSSGRDWEQQPKKLWCDSKQEPIYHSFVTHCIFYIAVWLEVRQTHEASVELEPQAGRSLEKRCTWSPKKAW